MQGKRPVNFAIARYVMVALQIPIEALVIVIIPEAALCPAVPGDCAQNLTPPSKLVDGKLAFEKRVMLQNDPHVVDGGLGQPGLGVHGQLAHPVGGVILIGWLHTLKIPDGLLVALLAHQSGHIGILDSQLAHGLVGWQAVCGCAWLGLIVLVPKAMETNQVKGVDQPSAARVSGVVAVKEFAIVVDYSSAGGRAPQVGVPTRHTIHRIIHTRDELIHSTVNVIGAAECTHHAILGLWITLLDSQLWEAQSTRNLRPGGAVLPVGVLAQDAISGEEGLVLPAVNILAVRAAGRPIHKPGNLKSSWVAQLQTYVLGHFPGNRLILICRYSSVRRD